MAGTPKGTCPACKRKGLMAPRGGRRQCLHCNEIVPVADMRNLPVRACSIVCKAHPEWGSWGVMEDRGGYYEIHASNGQGGRILDKSEAAEHWELRE